MSQIEAGWATGTTEVIGISNRLPFHAVPPGGSVVEGFRPRIGNLISQSLGETFVHLELEGVVVRLADAAVVKRRRNVRVERARLRVARAWRLRHIIVSADIHAPRSRSDVIDRNRGGYGYLMLYAKIP